METTNTIYIKDRIDIQNRFEIILAKGKRPVLKIYEEIEFKEVLDLLNTYSLKLEDVIIEPRQEEFTLPVYPYPTRDYPFYGPFYPNDFFKIISSGTGTVSANEDIYGGTHYNLDYRFTPSCTN